MKTFCYDDVPVLETTSGKLKGYFYDGAYIFKGIPYAYADRFQMPSETKWEGSYILWLCMSAYESGHAQCGAARSPSVLAAG